MAKPILRRALVGWTGSNADKSRLFDVIRWLDDHRPVEASVRHRIVDVKFDLTYQGEPTAEYGADFLLDNRSFELVVLNHLFVGWEESESAKDRPTFADQWWFKTSPLHSAEAWRQRLIASGARRIFAFGSFSEVASSFLLQIPGYQKTMESFGAVYEKDTTMPDRRRYDLYDPAQRSYRIQYAALCIKRGMNSGSRHFDTCFEMGDGHDVAIALLKRGLRDADFREALYDSPLVGLDHWLNQLYPRFKTEYDAIEVKYSRRNPNFR